MNIDTNRVLTTVVGALLAAIVIYQFKIKTAGIVDDG